MLSRMAANATPCDDGDLRQRRQRLVDRPHAVASTLQGRDRPVKLYEMHEARGTFRLKRRRLDEDELSVYYLRRALSASEGFEGIETDEPDSRS